MTDTSADEDWARLLAVVAEQGDSNEAAGSIEVFIDLHADGYASRIERQAWDDPTFAMLVAHAHLGDMSGEGVDRVRRLQDDLYERGDVGTRWQGWAPLGPSDWQEDGPERR